MNDSILDLIRSHGGPEEVIQKRIAVALSALEEAEAIRNMNRVNRGRSYLNINSQSDESATTTDDKVLEAIKNAGNNLDALVEEYRAVWRMTQQNLASAIQNLGLDCNVAEGPKSIISALFKKEMSDNDYHVWQDAGGEIRVAKR